MLMDEEIISLIRTAVSTAQLRVNSRRLEHVTLGNIHLTSINPCDNPDSNYSFNGYGDVTQVIDDNSQITNLCDFSGFAMVKDGVAAIVNGISIDSGLPVSLI